MKGWSWSCGYGFAILTNSASPSCLYQRIRGFVDFKPHGYNGGYQNFVWGLFCMHQIQICEPLCFGVHEFSQHGKGRRWSASSWESIVVHYIEQEHIPKQNDLDGKQRQKNTWKKPAWKCPTWGSLLLRMAAPFFPRWRTRRASSDMTMSATSKGQKVANSECQNQRWGFRCRSTQN